MTPMRSVSDVLRPGPTVTEAVSGGGRRMTTPTAPPPGPHARTNASGSGGGGIQISSRQVVAITLAIAVVLAVVIGVLLAGGSSEAGGQTVQLEQTTTSGDNPFMPSLVPGGSTPPSTTAPASPTGPFGGTGDDKLCDRDRLLTFLTDPTHVSQANAWAGVFGHLGAQPRDLRAHARSHRAPRRRGDQLLVRRRARGAVPGSAPDGNHGARRHAGRAGRTVPVGQPVARSPPAGEPGLHGTALARLRPEDDRDHRGLEPAGVFTPGTGELDDYDVTFTARGANIQTTDSLATVTWRGTLTVNRNGTLTGRAHGRLTFAGGSSRPMWGTRTCSSTRPSTSLSPAPPGARAEPHLHPRLQRHCAGDRCRQRRQPRRTLSRPGDRPRTRARHPGPRPITVPAHRGDDPGHVRSLQPRHQPVLTSPALSYTTDAPDTTDRCGTRR